MEQSYTQLNRCAIMKWLQNEIFDTMAGAASKRDCVIFKGSQWDFRKDNSAVNSEHINQLNADNSLLSRAWESRFTGFDTRMYFVHHAFLQRDLLVVSAKFWGCSQQARFMLLVTPPFQNQQVCFEF